MRNFVTKLRSPRPSVLSQRLEDRSKYVPHCGKKEYLKAWKRVLVQQRKEQENGRIYEGTYRAHEV